MFDRLSLIDWDSMPAAERRVRAKRLVSQLPSGFSFRSLKTFRLGGQIHVVALYELAGAIFAFIPGGSTRLGYDPDRVWEPTPDEKQSWQDSVEEYGFRRKLRQHIAKVTLTRRNVRIRSFLLETTAREVGWEPIPLDDPDVKEIVRENFRGKGSVQVEVHQGNSTIRVQRGAHGALQAQRAVVCTHKGLTTQLAKAGFRFPTSDEWEYACGGGGGDTLFRWGDHVPCDRYPIDVNAEEEEWHRQWVKSGSKLKGPIETFAAGWNLHKCANAFGIYIASDPYKSELVAEPNLTRGGDAGFIICGGAGFFLGWLTLATAYFESHLCKRKSTHPINPGYTIGRRLLPLG